jgi:hypothetical protein
LHVQHQGRVGENLASYSLKARVHMQYKEAMLRVVICKSTGAPELTAANFRDMMES